MEKSPMGKYDKEKKDVLKGARWLSDHGYFAAQRRTGGNVSTIIKKNNLVLMSPCNRPYQDLTTNVFVTWVKRFTVQGSRLSNSNLQTYKEL
jgi:ribulose-5-phosphate 4-epimerase/fuculose-1-phosphate aldolase